MLSPCTVQVAALAEQHRKSAPATGASSSDSSATAAAASTAPVSVRLQTFPRSLETFLVKDHALGEKKGIESAQYPVSGTTLQCTRSMLVYIAVYES
jgi:hypothetical protein